MGTDTDIHLALVGTREEQKLAGQVFEVMKRKGILFASNAPIRMTLEAIAKALTKEGGLLAGSNPAKLMPKIENTLLKNEVVFAREEDGSFVTTKAGHPYRASASSNVHTFKDRLNTEAVALDAEAAKEYADSLIDRAAARAERMTLMDSIIDMPIMPVMSSPPATHHAPHITFDNTTVIPQHLYTAPPTVEPPAPPEEVKAPEPQTIVPAPAETKPTAPATASTTLPQPTRQEEIAPASRAETAPAPTDSAEVPVATSAPLPPARRATAPAPPALTPAPPTRQPAAEVRPKPAPAERKEPPAPVITGPVEMTISTAEGPLNVDLRKPVEEILSNPAIEQALSEMISALAEEDTRLVRFGSDIFPEEAIERFSKGDFRRIKEFLDEPDTGGVASDRDFMDYVLNRRPEAPDYERLRFSLNYRMLKEKKDFEFVGIDSNRLWMNAGATPVASPKRKPAEIGQDYRYLEDPAITSVEEEEQNQKELAGPLEYSLTYYEYENGVLPYDQRAKQIFEGPMLEDQRVSLLQFEIPQLYSTLLAELRYPTGNRGGFIMGLADFFATQMVPGAKFTVQPTDRAGNIFEIQFKAVKEQEDNLLQFDERKSRYVFRPVSFAVETNPTMLLTQEKTGKLHNQKKLDEPERKRPDVIITNAFEVIGEQSDGKYWAILEDIYPIVNIERPLSRSWLKTLLSGAYPFFYADESTEGAYFYDPSKRPA